MQESPVKCQVIPVTPYQQNCSLLWCTETRQAAVVDPGGEIDRIIAAAEAENLQIVKILITHGHLDHCAGTAELRDRLSIPVEGPQQEDQFWIEQLPVMCANMGFPPAEVFTPDRWLEDGDTVELGKLKLEVIHCPGHTPGHVVFFLPNVNLALVGDVIFQGSIGRTDFPRGDMDTLLGSIRNKLFPLGDDVAFVPGHGPTSTFGHERQTNPFVSDSRYG